MRRFTLPVGALIGLGACADSGMPLPDRCNIVIAQVTPNGSTLYVSDTLTFHAAYTAGISADCIPGVPASSLRWTSSNLQLASVDSMTGKLTARALGTLSVMVHAPGSDAGLGSAQVSVIAHNP